MDPSSIKDRFAAFRAVDADRQEFLDILLRRLSQLEKESRQHKSDLEAEQHIRRLYQEEIDNFNQAISRNKFVHVLIDGDGYVFSEKFLKNRDSGGIEAAHELRSCVKEYISTNHCSGRTPDYDIMVTVLANKKGLAKTMAEAQLTTGASDLDEFFCKFNQSQPLFQFVDCGVGKEMVDSKFRALYRHYVYNHQCQLVFLAACHDNGYSSELMQYTRDEIAAKKTILVEHVQQGKQFASLPFAMANFSRVFRREPLVTLKRPGQKTAWYGPATEAGAPSLSQTINGHQPSSHAVIKSMADRAATGPTSPISTIFGFNGDGGVCLPQNTNADDQEVRHDYRFYNARQNDIVIRATDPTAVPVNRAGERVDRKLTPISNSDMKRFEETAKAKKFCNEFYLRGKCYRSNNNACPYRHDKMEATMLLALRYVARKHPCQFGLRCRRANCYNGHICPFTPNCEPERCRFNQNGMHDISQEIDRHVPATSDGLPSPVKEEYKA